VTRKLQDKLNLIRAAFPRAISILLLAFIICGTTVEAAHNHGNLPGSNKVTSAAHFSDPATESKLDAGSLNCSDCLICQLHQNFSATVISVPPSIGPSAAGFHVFNLTTVSVHSQSATPQRGRAPPFTL
jgi:hypothetical protein